MPDLVPDNVEKYYLAGTVTTNPDPKACIVFGPCNVKVPFSLGRASDGRTAGHWKDNLGLGAMDPTLAPGELKQVSGYDVEALSMLGWSVREAAKKPSPGPNPGPVFICDARTICGEDTVSTALPPGINRPPVLTPIGAKTVNEGRTLLFKAIASDADGDSLVFTGTNLPAGATLSSGGAFSWTPGFTQAGTYGVTITVSDGTSTASETFTVTVANVNRPPVLTPRPIGNRIVIAGQTLSITLNATDPDGGVPTYTAANLPSGATLTLGANGATTFRWTPLASQVGTYPNLTITVREPARLCWLPPSRSPSP